MVASYAKAMTMVTRYAKSGTRRAGGPTGRWRVTRQPAGERSKAASVAVAGERSAREPHQNANALLQPGMAGQGALAQFVREVTGAMP